MHIYFSHDGFLALALGLWELLRALRPKIAQTLTITARDPHPAPSRSEESDVRAPQWRRHL
ncbi:MAG TPA: hypothetical protein PKK97_02505 [Thauera aminoaromatica]|jgi:hypothetical protein|uniref:Uncharacterized protein n=2 Tax=Thauera aminoaromatica TaxID=164330 RepID=A0A5C7SJN7_THASP|nr:MULTISPECIES: hypothetical protein [Thauera]MDA0234785.1 hypothetical protein [Pseudomonadota bacterium]MBL8462807.1 hypothetical protein [Thauera sp.]MCK6396982.1 hypothetical protein [Thauera aminoaromatica]TXH84004.1 MAG: hypothetical protein E6Q80_12500 [Thauera aminoaromatica]HMU17479.1 hypothetical protein [Thauera aminoaromatica]